MAHSFMHMWHQCCGAVHCTTYTHASRQQHAALPATSLWHNSAAAALLHHSDLLAAAMRALARPDSVL